ncbi:Protein involved in initiation of plasmid replication [Lachnospiraceae bacterium NK3A20]|nr:Protein involved in initiation of plasmid replication [Lachnospiraceae bacterium NK3A20]
MARKRQEPQSPFIPTEINSFKKSNFLIGSKYKSSLLENKIMAISLANADKFETGQSDNESVYSVMKVSELRKTLGANPGSFYQQLNQVAKEMTGKSIGMSSEDSHTFSYVAVVISATCKDGVFTIEYNHALRDRLLQIKKNYSRLNLSIMLKFTSNYSFRLYELLKSKCYRTKGDLTRGSTYYIRFGLAELKLELGIVNAELSTVKKILNGSANPDFEKAVDTSPEKMFRTWSDFRRKVLDRAVTEINDISDMRVSYDTIKHGQGGKVCDVDFVVEITDPNAEEIAEEPKREPTEDEKLDIIFDVRSLPGAAFTSKEARLISEAAGYDLTKIQRAYTLMGEASHVKNPTGWMITALREGYAPYTDGAVTSKSSSRNTFNRFEQNRYDFDSLETDLADNL